MSLGIDYLTRSGAIKEFFEVPSTLLVESNDKKSKKVIRFKESLDHPDFYTSRIFHLDVTETETELPISNECLVPKSEIFVHNKAILPGYAPILYYPTSVDHKQNVYNSPMDDMTYRCFIENYLVSSRHKSWRVDWLWNAYVSMYLPKMSDSVWHTRNYWQKRLIVEREQSIVRGTKARSYWIKWAAWRNELITDDSSPNELIFKWAYDEQKKRLTASSSSSSQQT